MLNGEERRQEIISQLQESSGPVNGEALSRKFGVSRQVIVQDIALLRAREYEIISTNRGYLLNGTKKQEKKQLVVMVHHLDDQMENELNAVVDVGASVKDVYIQHSVYGKVQADLNIHSRRDVKKFMESIKDGSSTPLKNLTMNEHYHTLEADDEETLQLAADELKKIGVLIS